MQTLQKYTSFAYADSIVTDGRIILLDEPLLMSARAALSALETVDGRDVLFLDDRELATQTEEILRGIVDHRREILFVFPGNGSQYPYRLSRISQQSRQATVFAKRLWKHGSDPIALAGRIAGPFLVTDVDTVLVVDDVISSGLTMRMIHTANAWRFTRAQWIGVSWVSQIPQMKARSGVNGYAQIMTACVIGKPNGGRVPINSISTLRRDPQIAESYAHRHFKDPRTFLQIITEPSVVAIHA